MAMGSMVKSVVRSKASLWVFGWVGAAVLGGCGSTVEIRPEARSLAPTITAIVALPTSVDFGEPNDQRRLQRRTGDRLLELTGGHAVIAEELRTGDDDASVRETLRALGEDGGSALTFSVSVGVGKRLVNNANPISSFNATRRLVVDFTARIEVRHVGAPALIGAVESIASGPANAPEIGPGGQRQGPLEAIDDALEKAVGAFAPRLLVTRRSTLIVEIPLEASASIVKRLGALGELYPELTVDEMQRLAQSRERFLVVEPGALAPLGLLRGDLVGVPGGETEASRAALLRAVARGRKPELAIERGGQHYLIAVAP